MKATRWHKLRSLSLSDVWLLTEAAVLVGVFDLGVRLFSSKTCLAFFIGKAIPERRCQEVDRQRIAWLVDVADRYAPGRSSCLRQSATLAWLLRRRGVRTSLRIGVAKEGDNIVAHSWIESEEGELFGLCDRDKYALLSSSTLPEPLRAGCER